MNARVGPLYVAQAVRDHQKRLEASRDRLQASAPAAVLAVVRNESGAEKRLAEIEAKLAATEFQLRHIPRAIELASERDGEALKSWLAARFEMPTDMLLQGLSKEACGEWCMNGVFGGCVLGGGCDDAGGRCFHPIKQAHDFPTIPSFTAAQGSVTLMKHPLSHHERAKQIFKAACQKLGVERKFA
jgi:hypothetical protein